MHHNHWKKTFSDSLERPNILHKEDDIHLVHYSPHKGLTHIDPKFKGTGVDARTKGRDTWHPHSFYYRHGTPKENVVGGNEYHVKINPKEHPIYDIGKDPEGLVRQSIEENQGAHNMEAVHEKLKSNGYHGFHNSTHESLPHVVAMYHALPVHNKEEKAEDMNQLEPLMKPYTSEAQRRWAHTAAGKKALGGNAAVHEWDEATKGKKLPEHVKKSEVLEKGALKNLATAAGVAAGLATAVPAMGPTNSPTQYNRQKMLNAIAQVESSGGQNTEHKPTSHGAAYGKWAVMPDTIRETIKMNPDLKQKHGKALRLKGENLKHYMQDNPGLDQEIVNRHLDRLEHHFGENPAAIASAWNSGISGTNHAMKEGQDLASHPYVQKIKRAYLGKK